MLELACNVVSLDKLHFGIGRNENANFSGYPNRER